MKTEFLFFARGFCNQSCIHAAKVTIHVLSTAVLIKSAFENAKLQKRHDRPLSISTSDLSVAGLQASFIREFFSQKPLVQQKFRNPSGKRREKRDFHA